MILETQHIIIKIKENSSIPKYIQVADSITADIESGKIKLGERIASINDLSGKNSMSRDTLKRRIKYSENVT